MKKNYLSSGSVSDLFWTEECCPEQNPTHLNMVKYMSKQVFTIINCPPYEFIGRKSMASPIISEYHQSSKSNISWVRTSIVIVLFLHEYWQGCLLPACSNKVQIESWKASVDGIGIPQLQSCRTHFNFVLYFPLFASYCDTVSGTGTMQITLTIRLLDIIAEQLTSVTGCTHQLPTTDPRYTNQQKNPWSWSGYISINFEMATCFQVGKF